MTKNDLLMIKGVARVEDRFPGTGHPVVRLYVWPWWYYPQGRRKRIEDTLHNRMHVGIWSTLHPYWGPLS